jgi:hypothetical protein
MEEGYFPLAASAITRRMSAKMLIQAVDTLRAELDNQKSGSALLSRDGQMFFQSKKSLFDFASEGYLAQES